MTKLASIPGRSSFFGSAISERTVTAMRVGIDARVDLGNLALEYAIGIGRHLDGDRLAQVKETECRFPGTSASIHLTETLATV